MQGHPDLRQASTQKGFADLVGCSQGLIRAVEQGQSKITPKLARKVHASTGVATVWLSKKQNPDQPVPAARGGPLTHEEILARWEEETARNIREAETERLVGTNVELEQEEGGKEHGVSMHRRMASVLGKLVEAAVFESLGRGENHLINEINRVLSRSYPPEPTPPMSSGGTTD